MKIVLIARRLLGNVLTKLGGRPTKLGGRSADLLKNHILKRLNLNLNLKQILNQGDQGKELTSGKSLLQISTIGNHSLQFQQSKQSWGIGKKELRMKAWRL